MAFDAFLRQTFPGVRITSGRRDPNSPLGRANPRSWHNQGKAWDTAPIEGMDFKDYVSRIGQDYNILEARDEVTNPSRHATGPHWHVAVGDRKEKPPVNNLASLLQGQPQLPQQQPTGLAGLLQQNQIGDPTAMPSLPETPQVKLKAFDKGGNGWQIMGLIGDALQTAGGGRGTYAPAMMDIREREELGRQKLAELMAQREQKQADRAAALEDWQFKEQYQRENPQPTQMTETERLIEAAATLPDDDPKKAMILRALRGSAYDPAVYQPKEDYSVAGRLKVKTTAPGKAPSGGGGTKSITSTARAKYISEAQAAIGRGADPAKVKARLLEMGVQ